MNKFNSFKESLFNINAENFEKHALQLFNFQANNNPIYKQYIGNINIKPENVNSLEKIPFLPIEFFKTQTVKTLDWGTEVIFESSGTTGQVRSKHHIEDCKFYNQVSKRFFEDKYGKLQNLNVMALLPSYLERGNSSLVAMVSYFIKESKSEFSGFYLYNFDELEENIIKLRDKSKPIILIGVSFALLDLAERLRSNHFSDVIVMETGGMKGRREELTREELHNVLKDSFKISAVHSEYGMTELLSQAYAKEDGIFEPPPWMKVLVREPNDPFNMVDQERTGGINIIDLANIHSCSFVETQDLGKKIGADCFNILGRFDNSDIRGCNLLSI